METIDHGDGFYICEVEDGIVTKQITSFNEQYYWATLYEEGDARFPFTDQPEYEYDEELDKHLNCHPITSEEFKKLWKLSKQQCAK